MLRNPLADPFVLGVSSGAALGSILALIIAPQIAALSPLGAFLGAIATIATVYFLGRRDGQLDNWQRYCLAELSPRLFSPRSLCF